MKICTIEAEHCFHGKHRYIETKIIEISVFKLNITDRKWYIIICGL